MPSQQPVITTISIVAAGPADSGPWARPTTEAIVDRPPGAGTRIPAEIPVPPAATR
jgi:hypothetical protein